MHLCIYNFERMSCIYIAIDKAPQIYSFIHFWVGGGGTFANILPRGDICQFLAKIQPTTGKRPFRNENKIICIKNI